jgi:hypothetical protein
MKQEEAALPHNNGSSESDEMAIKETKARRYWDWGATSTEVRILDDWIDDDMGIEIKLTWEGDFESPEEWSIRWVHPVSYLARELGDYLYKHCPAPNEVLTTLHSWGLPPGAKEVWDATVEADAAEQAKREAEQEAKARREIAQALKLSPEAQGLLVRLQSAKKKA